MKVQSLYTATTIDLTSVDLSVLLGWYYGKNKLVFSELLENNEDYKAAITEINEWTSINTPYLHDLVSNDTKYKIGLPVLISSLIIAQQKGLIENVHYKRFKDEFSSLIDKVFINAKAQLIELYGRREIDVNREFGNAIIFSCPTNLHEVGSALKKFSSLTKYVDEYTDPAPILFELTKLLNEVNIFHLASKELKEIITATVRKKLEVNVDQGEKLTCSCCFRPIRLQNKKSNTIAYHGFKRDWYGITSSSCRGSWYAPFEHSCEGTLFYLKELKQYLIVQKDLLSKLETELGLLSLIDKNYQKMKFNISQLNSLIEREIPFTKEMLLNAIKMRYPDQYEHAVSLVNGDESK